MQESAGLINYKIDAQTSIECYDSYHTEYGMIWQKIKNEFELTKKNLLLLGDHDVLMEAYPVERLSVNLRERIILPVNTIQQYALSRLRDLDADDANSLKDAYEKMVVRCAFGIIMPDEILRNIDMATGNILHGC